MCQSPCAEMGSPNHKKCSTYRNWFAWWWNYFQKLFGVAPDDASLQESADKFCYRHPEEIKWNLLQRRKEVAEEIRVTSAKKPCTRCGKESACEIPCDVYLRWYDESLALIRKQVGK